MADDENNRSYLVRLMPFDKKENCFMMNDTLIRESRQKIQIDEINEDHEAFLEIIEKTRRNETGKFKYDGKRKPVSFYEEFIMK
jgi:hypothetical protein